MKYVHLEKETHRILGWYDKKIHGVFVEAQYKEIENKTNIEKELIKEAFWDISNIPTPNIEVDESTWKKAIDINANAYDKDSKTFVVKDFRTKKEILEEAKAEAKIQKEKELKELKITHHTVLYDANGEALGNMATVIAIANATFNKAISIGINGSIMSLEDAYNYVYKNQTVAWKGVDNKGHNIQLESLVETAQLAMTKKSEILFKYK